MLDIPGGRGFLRVGAASLIGLTTADWFRLKGQAAAAPKAKSVIQLWMAGGPTQTATWDPKPNAGEDFTGPLRRTISTNVNGVVIGELLPLSAKQADKYTIIRSMTHGDTGHETAAYIMQTGSKPTAELVYPAMGAIVALKKGEHSGLPPYITLTNPLGRFTESGFLGHRSAAFAPRCDPHNPNFRVQGPVPPRGVPEQPISDRPGLLTQG